MRKWLFFDIFKKQKKLLREHFQEASNNKSFEIGLSRVESESVAESLEVVNQVNILQIFKKMIRIVVME